jgi:hypothetical protein
MTNYDTTTKLGTPTVARDAVWAAINDLMSAAWAAYDAGQFDMNGSPGHRSYTVEYKVFRAVASALSSVFGCSTYDLIEAAEAAVRVDRPEWDSMDARYAIQGVDQVERDACRRTYSSARSCHDLAVRLGKGYPNS